MNNTGWICPRCERVWAPSVTGCECALDVKRPERHEHNTSRVETIADVAYRWCECGARSECSPDNAKWSRWTEFFVKEPPNDRYPPATESGCAPPLWRLRNTRNGVAVEPYAEIIKPDEPASEDTTLIQKIAKALNMHSRENGSDTPDFILAEYLTDCLAAWDKSCQSRKNWYAP